MQKSLWGAEDAEVGGFSGTWMATDITSSDVDKEEVLVGSCSNEGEGGST